MKLSGNRNYIKRVCGKCAGIHKGLSAKRKHCLSPLESMSWTDCNNQMTASNSNQRKQAIKKEIKSAFPFIFLSCFHSISSIFNLINFIINFFEAAKRILINYFIKEMKKEIKLESRPDTLIAVSLISNGESGLKHAGSYAGMRKRKQELSEINDRSALLSKLIMV